MISNLYIKNFKSLKEVNLELRPLNLLTGLNGSGKSSLIQALLLTRQNKNRLFEQGTQNRTFRLSFDSNVFGIDAVQTFEDIYYRHTIPPIEIAFRYTFSNKDNFEIYYTSQDIYIYTNDIVITYIEYKSFGYEPPFRFTKDDITSQNDNGRLFYIKDKLQNYALFSDKFQYLFAERRYLDNDQQPVSVEDAINRKTLGTRGQHTSFYLKTYGLEKKVEHDFLKHEKAKDDFLLHQLDAWLSEISPNVNLITQLKNDSREITIFFQYGREKYKPKNVGFGLSYVLPVVTALLTAEEGKLIIIENPEAHIHPRGQVELGRLIAAAAQTGAQLIIETHSDHILNGIRIAVKEGLASPDSVIAYYFKRNEEDNSSDISSILIDNKAKLYQKTPEGSIAQLPKGFFDDWINSMSKLF